MSEAWKQWQGQVVDGKFPLRQYLGGSEYSAVFLTERGEPTQKAAIKFIQVDAAELQLSRWKRAAQLSHPHLLRVFDSGRCRLGDFDLLYAVMEYAEENLAQFLPQRPLTPAEARDVLTPALDALAYLHAEGLVHGHVRPSNIMAIDDCLKLSSDAISSIAEHSQSSEASTESGRGAVPTSLRNQAPYDAPEAADGNISPAADIWSLGMTLVEMLTQRLPVLEADTLPSVRPQDPQLPDTLPALFLDIAKHCLQRDPHRRWTVVEISARLNPTTPAVKRALAQAEPVSQSLAASRSETGYQPAAAARPPLHAQTVATRDSFSKPRYDLAPPHLKRPPLMPKSNYVVLGILAAVALAAILVGPRLLNHRTSTEKTSSTEPKETSASKPLQPPTRAKEQAKAAPKPAAPSSAQSAQAPQHPGQVASLPTPAHDKQAGVSQPASPTKIAATPAAARSEAARVATSSGTAVKSSSGAAPGEVLAQVLPEPSQKAQATIRGKVRVRVKVHVDAAGGVSGAEFDSPGPSKYFADLALQAARRWDFAPAKVDGHAVPSEWLIVFHFTPSGPKVFPTQSNP
jgi:TonB family protein